ncbi:MAG: hypothetical protein A3E31_14790 [Candidatus Rokubacteria bacterium RIFCSPHIGHO2_12_FULL_73_22]|nr:MAG: hypothetical protein A3E31_14790 [Candidatus Rokubacteria bacterium RIFCSPHIGHO2_12_FULL_73_22]OGL08014.1 MAG: hypothetical protein A3I14_14660 [Candidatus Rokubacteria bacterium RIFCSPLOWO2_02_FULL_73_56]
MGAPAVLLLHGLGSSADDWVLQLPLLTPFYRVLLVDLPGHGRSALPPGRLTVEGMAGAVDALLAGWRARPRRRWRRGPPDRQGARTRRPSRSAACA